MHGSNFKRDFKITIDEAMMLKPTVIDFGFKLDFPKFDSKLIWLLFFSIEYMEESTIFNSMAYKKMDKKGNLVDSEYKKHLVKLNEAIYPVLFKRKKLYNELNLGKLLSKHDIDKLNRHDDINLSALNTAYNDFISNFKMTWKERNKYPEIDQERRLNFKRDEMIKFKYNSKNNGILESLSSSNSQINLHEINLRKMKAIDSRNMHSIIAISSLLLAIASIVLFILSTVGIIKNK